MGNILESKPLDAKSRKARALTQPFRHLLLIVYVFYVIYHPTFSSSPIFNKYIVLTVLAVVLLVPYFFEPDNYVKRIFEIWQTQAIMALTITCSIYLVIVMIFNGQPIESLDDTRLLQNNVLNLMIIHAAIIFDKLRKLGFTSKRMFELLLKLAAFQGLFVIGGLLVPQIKNFSVHLYNIGGTENVWTEATRIYGFMGEFTFVTPIYHGLLAGIAVYLTLTRSVNYLAYLPLILVAILFNGRTGLVIFFVVFAITSIWVLTKQGRFHTMLGYVFALFAGGYILIAIMDRLNPLTASFLRRFFEDTAKLLFEGESTGNYEVLNEELFTFPQGMEFLFGTGEHVYKSTSGFRADSGFTNDIFFGGIFYVLVFYICFLLFLISGNELDKILFFSLGVAILFASYKGQIMRGSSVLFLLVFIKMLSFAEFDGYKRRTVDFLNRRKASVRDRADRASVGVIK